MGFLEKGMLLYFVLALAVAFWQPAYVFDSEQGKTVLDVVGIDSYDEETNMPVYGQTANFSGESSEAQEALTQSGGESIFGSLQFIIDPVFNAIGWVKLLGKFLFSPVLIFFNPIMSEAPAPILFLFAMPLIFLVLMGIIYFVRSGS